MSGKSSGLRPIGLAFGAGLIDLARRTGRLSQYRRLRKAAALATAQPRAIQQHE